MVFKGKDVFSKPAAAEDEGLDFDEMADMPLSDDDMSDDDGMQISAAWGANLIFNGGENGKWKSSNAESSHKTGQLTVTQATLVPNFSAEKQRAELWLRMKKGDQMEEYTVCCLTEENPVQVLSTELFLSAEFELVARHGNVDVVGAYTARLSGDEIQQLAEDMAEDDDGPIVNV
eukprot:NODE_8143_length_563_cov_31.651376_g8120_i0.p1 GENE.NODE_8143_length_563_cov_31.651376_g8120_i0~~NODE_8143_length_563_cov_31.651376_g8120_i0.p1  ORF type:complete len:175 (-),score=53.44 NODE_8143_length_563_cov_31.651376_g8120_i0:7-531(-)